MKRLIATTVSLILAMSMLTGCGEENASAAQGDDKIQIGVVQISEHPSLNEIRQAFLDEMANQGYDDKKVEYDIQNAQDDVTNLNTICKKFVGDKVDMIVAIATPTAQTAASVTQDIPVLFSAVTDPVAAKLVESMEKPTANVTGTSDAIPVDQVLQLCKTLTPDVKKIGFLYTASEINSEVTIEKAKEIAPQMGFEFEIVTISENSELQQAAESLAAKVDAIYVPIDNTIATAMKILTTVGRERKIPVYVGADSMVQDGGFATVGIEYSSLGVETAKMAKEILEGKAVSEMPVRTMQDFSVYINKDTAKAIEVSIPEETAKMAQFFEDQK